MTRRPPRSTLFPTRRSSDLLQTPQTQPAGAPAPHYRGGRGGRCGRRRDRHGRRDSAVQAQDRKSTRLNSSHPSISYAVFCLKKKKKTTQTHTAANIVVTQTS